MTEARSFIAKLVTKPDRRDEFIALQTELKGLVFQHEPDALVYCGTKLPASAVEVPDPVIIVEVLSRSTRHIDLSAKLADYFRLPSIVHYLIVDPEKPRLVHHARVGGNTITTRIITEGDVMLDPPGIEFSLADIYSG